MFQTTNQPTVYLSRYTKKIKKTTVYWNCCHPKTSQSSLFSGVLLMPWRGLTSCLTQVIMYSLGLRDPKKKMEESLHLIHPSLR